MRALESGLRTFRAVLPRGPNVRSPNSCSVDKLVDELVEKPLPGPSEAA
jgi:hypothetical protein